MHETIFMFTSVIEKCFLFALEILTLLPRVFGYTKKQLVKKATADFKIYDVTDWATNNYNTHIPNIARSKSNQTMKFGQLMENNVKNIFLTKHSQTVEEKPVPDPLIKNQN